jgi:ArsR family transcriptional regulator
MPKIDHAKLALSATAATRLLKALANRNRLLILCQLSDGELQVGELSDRVNLSPSALSQHLAGLKRQGIVVARRHARTMHYRLAKGPAQQIMKTLADIYCPPASTGSLPSDRRSRRRSAPAA